MAVASGFAIGVLAALIWGGLDAATGGPSFLRSLPGHLAVTLAAATVVCLFGHGSGAGGPKRAPESSAVVSPYASRRTD